MDDKKHMEELKRMGWYLPSASERYLKCIYICLDLADKATESKNPEDLRLAMLVSMYFKRGNLDLVEMFDSRESTAETNEGD